MIYAIIITAIILFIYTARQKDNDKPLNKSVQKIVQTNKVEHTDYISWELVRRKSERWHQLGFGEGETFPGYGKLYDREFDVWYCDIGSKVKKDMQKFYDRNPLHYEPKDRLRDIVQSPNATNHQRKMSSEIMGEGIFLERLHNTKEFVSLYSGLDKKNRKRWYFALTKYTPTGIETDRALD